MPRRLLAVVAVALVALVAWSVWPDSDSVVGLEGAAERVDCAIAEQPAQSLAGATADDADRMELVPSAESVEATSGSTDADAAPQPATVRGRLLDHTGTPLTDARISLSGTPSRAGQLKDEVRLNLETAPEPGGSFAFVFVPPDGYRFSLATDRPGGPYVRQEFGTIAPGAVIDVGTIVFPATGSISGRVVTSDGAPVPAAWRVRVEPHWAPDGADSYSGSTSAKVEGEDARFRIDGVPVGSALVSVETFRLPASRIRDRTVEVRAGETTEVEFVYDGPNPGTSIQFAFSSKHAAWDEFPTPESFALIGPDGRQVSAVDILGEHGVRTATNLGSGPYRMTIEDPRFEPVERFGLEVGTVEKVELEGSSRVTVVAIDAATGERVEGLTIVARRPTSTEASRDRQQLSPIASDDDGHPVYRTVPDPQRWTVEAPGYDEHEQAFPVGFAPNALQRVDLTLDRGLVIVGRLIDETGGSVEGRGVKAQVVLDPDDESHADLSPIERMRRDANPPSAKTDAEGNFVIGPLDPGRYDLFGYEPRQSPPCVFGVEAGTEGVELRVEGFGSIVGRFDPIFPAVERATVTVRRLFDDDDLQTRYDRATGGHRLAWILPGAIHADSTGVFRVTQLVPGRYEVQGEAPRGVHGSVTSPKSYGGLGGRPDSVVVEVVAGVATEAVIGPGEWSPGAARITVRANGEPLPGVHVSGYLLQPDDPRVGDDLPRRRSAAGTPDGSGVAEVVPLQAGTWWFEVESVLPAWSVRVPGVHTVEPGAELHLAVDFTLVTSKFVVVDPDGVPLANHRVEVDTTTRTRWVDSDGEGAIEITRPPGTYEIHGAIPRDGGVRELTHGGAFVEWTANGPTEERVVVEPLE
jgi:hypothetical protein